MVFFSAADRLLGLTAVRWLICIGYICLGAFIAVLFPDTPDELSRIEIARTYQAGGAYSFFWPQGNMLTILANPLLGRGIIDDVTAVRLFNLVLAGLPLCVLLFRVRNAALMVVALFTAPYGYLVLSTGSQQGLMVGIFVILVWAVADRRLGVFALGALALYLVNPAMVLALPLTMGLAVLFGRDPWFVRAFAMACLAYLPILVTAFVIWSDSGRFMPTLSGNGPVNVFLGNNPDALSHRGVGNLETTLEGYGLAEDSTHLDAVHAYAKDDPLGLITNLGRKAVLYWMPWDFLRSGMGQGVSTVLFTYIAMAQIAIYTAFWMSFRHLERGQALFAISFCIMAWALYTAFFVKIRFRVPFDMLLLLTCLVAPAISGRRTGPIDRD